MPTTSPLLMELEQIYERRTITEDDYQLHRRWIEVNWNDLQLLAGQLGTTVADLLGGDYTYVACYGGSRHDFPPNIFYPVEGNILDGWAVVDFVCQLCRKRKRCVVDEHLRKLAKPRYLKERGRFDLRGQDGNIIARSDAAAVNNYFLLQGRLKILAKQRKIVRPDNVVYLAQAR